MYSSPPPVETIPREQAGWIVCPNCRELNAADEECCGLCGRSLSEAVAADQLRQPVRLLAAGRAWQFSLETLMLLVTLASVLLAFAVAMPGLGILAMVGTIPVVLLAFALDERYRSAGRTVTLEIRLWHFLRAFKMTVASGVAGVVTGLLIVAVGFIPFSLYNGPGNVGYLTAFLVCAFVAGLAVMLRVYAELWPQQFSPPARCGPRVPADSPDLPDLS